MRRMRFGDLRAQLARLDAQLVDVPSRTTLTLLKTRSQALYPQLQPGIFLDSARFHALDPSFDALHASARGRVVRQAHHERLREQHWVAVSSRFLETRQSF